MALATLSIDLVAKLAGLEEGMTRAARITERNAAQIQASMDRVRSQTLALSRALGGLFAGFSVVSFVRSTVDGLDALNDLKDATGASIENLSALEDVAARTGTSFEGVGTALVKFNKVLSDAKPGSETSNIIKAIGLDAEKLKSIDPAEALRQVAVALAGFADDGNKARVVQELFGKSVREVAPFLNDLAKQTQLVAKVTTEQAEAAEKFNQQLDGLAKNSKDASRALISDLLPTMNELLRQFTIGKEVFGGFLGALKNIGTARPFTNAVEGLQFYRSELDKVQGSLDRIASGKEAPTGFFGTDRIGPLKEQQADLQKFVTYYERLLNLSSTAGAGRGVAIPGDKGAPTLKVPPLAAKEKEDKEQKDRITDAQRALMQYIDAVERAIEKERDMTEVQKGVNLLQSLGTIGQIPQVRQLVLELAKKRDALEAEKELQEGLARLDQERADNLRKLDSEIDNASGRVLDQKKRELTERLEARIKAGELFSPDELERITLGIAGISKAVIETGGDIKSFAMTAAENIDQVLGQNVQDTLAGRFDNIGQAWARMLESMAAQAIQTKLTDLLLGDFKNTNKLGGLAGSFLSLFGSARGNVFGPAGVQAFARGGIVSAPTMFGFGAGNLGIMGEAGPEAVMPLKRGRDGRLGVVQAGGGTVVNNTTINVAGGIGRSEVLGLLNLGLQSFEGRIERRLSRAGV